MPTSELLCFADCGLVLLASPLRSDVDVDVESGLGGRLLTLALFGGTGNAPTLVGLRRVLPGVGSEDAGDGEPVDGDCPEAVFSVGTAGVECVLVGRGVGRPDVVTARVSGLPTGVAIEDAEDVGRESAKSSGMAGNGLRSGPDGGAEGGAEGGGLRSTGRCGMAELIVAVAVIDMTPVKPCRCTSPSRRTRDPSASSARPRAWEGSSLL
jgi:hypothetical protein